MTRPDQSTIWNPEQHHPSFIVILDNFNIHGDDPQRFLVSRFLDLKASDPRGPLLCTFQTPLF